MELRQTTCGHRDQGNADGDTKGEVEVTGPMGRASGRKERKKKELGLMVVLFSPKQRGLKSGPRGGALPRRAGGRNRQPICKQRLYNLEERRLLAELICADTCDLDDGIKLKHRIYTTNAMILLGREREQRRVKSESKIKTDHFPTKCETNQCFMCFWDDRAPPSERFKKFCSSYRARDHLISRHLKGLVEHSVMCPEPRCRDKKHVFHELQSFQAHLTAAHSYNNFNRYKGLGKF